MNPNSTSHISDIPLQREREVDTAGITSDQTEVTSVPEAYVNPVTVNPIAGTFLLYPAAAEGYEQAERLVADKAHHLKEKLHEVGEKVKEKLS